MTDPVTTVTIKFNAQAILDDIKEAQKKHRAIPLHRISHWAKSIYNLAEQQIAFNNRNNI